MNKKLRRTIVIEYERPDGVDVAMFGGFDEHQMRLAEYGVCFGVASIVGAKTARSGVVVSDTSREVEPAVLDAL